MQLPQGCPPDWRQVSLGSAQLYGANLRGADLIGARLAGATLSRAGLRHADLRDADLSGVVMLDADISGADLRGATLTGHETVAFPLEYLNLRGIIVDEKTDIDDETRLSWQIVNMDGPCPDLTGTELPTADLDGADLQL